MRAQLCSEPEATGEHWLIWLTAIVVLSMVVATIGYFTLAHLTVAVASTG